MVREAAVELGVVAEELDYPSSPGQCALQLRGFHYLVTACFRRSRTGWRLLETYVEVSEDSSRVFTIEATCERLREIAKGRATEAGARRRFPRGPSLPRRRVVPSTVRTPHARSRA